jgi:hypothetical protein
VVRCRTGLLGLGCRVRDIYRLVPLKALRGSTALSCSSLLSPKQLCWQWGAVSRQRKKRLSDGRIRLAFLRFMNCRGDDDVDAKRSRPSIRKPAMCHASKERVLLVGTDQWITSGPAATTAAFKGRIHGCTRTIRGDVRFFSLAPRARGAQNLDAIGGTADIGRPPGPDRLRGL